jgi:hypothetical protein
MHACIQEAQEAATNMSTASRLAPCEGCNVAYAPASVMLDGKMATVIWARQKELFVFFQVPIVSSGGSKNRRDAASDSNVPADNSTVDNSTADNSTADNSTVDNSTSQTAAETQTETKCNITGPVSNYAKVSAHVYYI